MPILGLTEDTIVNIIGIILIPLVGVVIGYIRKVSKKIGETQECNKANSLAIGALEDKINKHEANVKEMFMDHKLEAKDDKMELKVLVNTVTTLTERVSESQRIHNEFREDIRMLEEKIVKSHDQLMGFFTDWMQRLEDVTRDNPSFISKNRQNKQDG